jgi:hypothetical protein
MPNRSPWYLSFVLLLLSALSATAADPPSIGPLRVHADNPCWFARPDGQAVWLTGSHTWANFQERGVEGQTPNFDYEAYLDFLQRHGHNFIRLWSWEQVQWMQFVDKETPVRYKPNPYQRTGPGKALDGGLKFDLTKFNNEYFQRLRRRIQLADQRGIYVSVMFFQGFSLDKRRGNTKAGNAWHGHPLNAANNINGVNGNPSGDDTGREVHELKVAEITRLQEAFVCRVVDTVGDLDNVLWEIGNECHAGSVKWQYHMIRFLKHYESTRSKQHPVGMTGAPISMPELLASPADWLSPPGKRWLTDPPANDGKKVILVDTDHCNPWKHNPDWVWKNLFRGNQFILMDGYVDFRIGSPDNPDPESDVTRQAMGRARALAKKIDLAGLTPNTKLASSGYCLATPVNGGGAFRCAVYLPNGGEATVDLTMAKGPLAVQWIVARSGEVRLAATVSGGSHRSFAAGFPGPAVLWLTDDPGNANRISKP